MDRLIQWKNDLTSNQRLVLDIAIPFMYFIPLGLSYFSPKFFGFGSRFLVYFGLSVGLFGLLLWILSMIHLGKSFAVMPGSSQIVNQGVYKYIRHPMYWGVSLTLFGLILACGSVFGMIYLAVVVFPLNIVRARLEEKILLHQFGDSYRDYLNSTWL